MLLLPVQEDAPGTSWGRLQVSAVAKVPGLHPREVKRCPLDKVGGGCPWHGPDCLLVESAVAIGHARDSEAWFGSSLSASFLATWLAHISISRLQFLVLGSVRFALIFVVINVFR